MNLKLPPEISSHQDLKQAILEVRQFGVWQAHKEVKSQVVGQDTGQPPAISQESIDLIKQWHTDGSVTKESITQLISALDNMASQAPRIHITLAAPPPGDLKKSLVSWCREQIDDNILVQIQFSSSILGGMVVRYGSHMHDWSFRRQILSSLEKFPEKLRNVR